MNRTESRTKQSLLSQLQQPISTPSLDARPIPHHDTVEDDVPIKEHQKPVGNETSYELEKREPIDSDLTDDSDIQKPAGSDISGDLEKQESQFSSAKGAAVGDQNEVPADDPNLVCLPLCAGRGKHID